MKYIITEHQLSFLINEVKNKKEDRDKIYEDENIVVVAPLTHRSSCKYGANTKWCVAVPSNDTHFKEYMDGGVLIYFIIRSPYKNSKIPEYKFAYYHSFDENMSEANGWYDMSDYHMDGDNTDDFDNERKNLDKNLIKFLIPEHIFDLVKTYIKNQKGAWTIRQKEKHKNMLNNFMSDPDNVDNLIVDDSTWFISYRTKKFDTYDFLYVYFNLKSAITVMFVNKKTNKIYYTYFPYYVDLRNFETKKADLRNIEFNDVFSDKEEPKMVSVLEKYYPQILKAYFKARKEFYSPGENDYLYMPPEYVEIGDEIGGDYGKVSNITIDNNGKYHFDTTNHKGGISKDVHYSNDIGLGVKYDKEKHNPIH